MLKYHLRHISYPRLVFLAAVVAAFVWLGFRPGGTEVGHIWGSYGVARYWALITPMTLLMVIPMIGELWNGNRLERNWRIAQVEPTRARKDRFTNFLAGFGVATALLVVFSLFAFLRLEPDVEAYGAFMVVLLVGPLAGMYATMSFGYVCGVVTRSPAARLAVIAAVAMLDIVNLVPTPIVSLSGTSREAARADAWTPDLTDPALLGSTIPSTWFWVGRLTLCVGFTVWLISAKVRYRMDLARVA